MTLGPTVRAGSSEPGPETMTQPPAGPDPDEPRGRRVGRVGVVGEPTAPQGVSPPPDASVMPSLRTPPVVGAGTTPGAKPRPRPKGLHGWSDALASPPMIDARRRQARTQRPADFGHTLGIGERFRFDVSFAGNPAGLAEAEITGIEPDPRGPPPAGAPMLRLEGHARTSGVVSLLATVTDDMVTYVDARTGAAISNYNVLHYSGFAPRKYTHRETRQAYEGRGQVRIVDTKDDEVEKKLHRVPIDTYDSLSVMAWVRSLRLEKGERAKAHVVDGLTLMRVEIECFGRDRLSPMPSMATALGLDPDDTIRIEGTITRVDEHGAAIPGKRAFSLRAWLSADERRIPLVMESDLWVGAIRLVLTGYDPPTETSGSSASAR
ncbi:DUF3108 domain-containing protein [Paraliomyxa miuraensis]|uniref:DUF3108 domain-containing protein n=1 Tax=Paraliomyxa miuraensis TaxID=376150 RepID=UPI00225BF183|nr:DUF3108 domain-containing protein [Paraliomyxa miuraensis]